MGSVETAKLRWERTKREKAFLKSLTSYKSRRRHTLRCAERDKRWAAQQKASRIFVKCVLKGEKSKAYRYRWLHVPKEEDYCRTRYISVLVNFGDPTHKCLSPHALHETSTPQPAAD